MQFGKTFLPEDQKAPEQVPADVVNTDPANEPNANEPNPENEPPVVDPPVNQEPPVTTEQELNDDQVLSYLTKKSGREISAIDELFKAPEKVIETKEVNPWEEHLDDDDIKYLNYKKETGRSRKEFEALNTNYDEINPVDLAIEKLRQESGMNLSKEQAYAVLEKQLNVDLSDLENIDDIDQVTLNTYTRAFKEQKKEDAQKYLAPIERTPKEGEIKLDEYQKFDDGSLVPKSVLEQRAKEIEEQKIQFLEENKKSVGGVAEAKFTLQVDDNGSRKDLSYTYEYSEEDRQDMLSRTNDISATVAREYSDENGAMNKASFNEDMFWSKKENREKAIASIAHKVRAELIEEIHKRDNNVNYQRNNIPNNGSKTVKIPLPGEKQGVGFKWNV